MRTITNDIKLEKPTFQKSSVANLYYYAPTGIYYARPRIKGKGKVKCLKTDKLTVAKQRLAVFLRKEHRNPETLCWK